MEQPGPEHDLPVALVPARHEADGATVTALLPDHRPGAESPRRTTAGEFTDAAGSGPTTSRRASPQRPRPRPRDTRPGRQRDHVRLTPRRTATPRASPGPTLDPGSVTGTQPAEPRTHTEEPGWPLRTTPAPDHSPRTTLCGLGSALSIVHLTLMALFTPEDLVHPGAV